MMMCGSQSQSSEPDQSWLALGEIDCEFFLSSRERERSKKTVASSPNIFFCSVYYILVLACDSWDSPLYQYHQRSVALLFLSILSLLSLAEMPKPCHSVQAKCLSGPDLWDGCWLLSTLRPGGWVLDAVCVCLCLFVSLLARVCIPCGCGFHLRMCGAAGNTQELSWVI